MVGDLMALREAVSTARFNSRELLDRSARNLARAQAECLTSRSRRRFAWLEGEIDGHHVVAIVRCDGSVVADRRHRERVSLLAAIGEILPNGAAAELGAEPLTSVLALMRACDLLISVHLRAGELATDLQPADDATAPSLAARCRPAEAGDPSRQHSPRLVPGGEGGLSG